MLSLVYDAWFGFSFCDAPSSTIIAMNTITHGGSLIKSPEIVV